MTSKQRHKLLLEQNANSILREINCVLVFLAYFQWGRQEIHGNGEMQFDEIKELIKWLSNSSNEIELFVMCLIQFGYYSLAHTFFNEINLEKLTSIHKRLSPFHPLCTFNFQQGHDLPDESRQFLTTRLQISPLQRHLHLISCKLEVEPVLNYFCENSLISNEELRQFRSFSSTSQQCSQFIEYINEDKFIHFCHSLLLSSQFELFAFLVDNSMDWKSLNSMGGKHREFLINQWEQENLLPLQPINNFDLDISENGLEFDFSVDMVDTMSAKDISYYANDKLNIYKNFSVPKGLVLLINNENFYCDLNPRHGTARDEENLRRLFTEIGYTVIDTCKDLTGLGMISVARQFVKRPEHYKAHSCVVVVLTHGGYDELIGVDGISTCTHDFLACFNSRNAPLLAGKPKLFIMQACRGGNYDMGVRYPIPLDEADSLKLTTQPDQSNFFSSFFNKIGFSNSPRERRSRIPPNSSIGMPIPTSTSPPFPHLTTRASIELNGSSRLHDFDTERCKLVKQPTEADILVAYATVPRYVSWRNSQKGSWFVQSICEIFGKHAAKDDLLTMLTKVNQLVAKRYESTDDSRSKQIPESISRLQRKFYFFPGVVSEE